MPGGDKAGWRGHRMRPGMTSRRNNIPAPKQVIRTPEIRLICRRFSVLSRDRTEPSEPQRMIHHTTEPRKTPATKVTAATSVVPCATTLNPGRIVIKKMMVSGLAAAIAKS